MRKSRLRKFSTATQRKRIGNDVAIFLEAEAC